MTIKKFRFLLCLLLSSLSTTSTASALHESAFFRDQISGLEWLTLTETKDQSFNEVSTRISDGGDLESWRFASLNELETLLINFGLVEDNGPGSGFMLGSPVNNGKVLTLIKILGPLWIRDTDNGDRIFSVMGWLGTPNFLSSFPGQVVATLEDTEVGSRDSRINASGNYYLENLDEKQFYLGSFLVRDSSINEVIEAPMYSIFIMGLLLLTLKSRRNH